MEIKAILLLLKDASPPILGIGAFCFLYRCLTEKSGKSSLPCWMRFSGFLLSLLCVMLILIFFRE